MKNCTLSFLRLLMLVMSLVAMHGAQAAFTINNDGTVTDPSTGLTWKRCSEGQTWNGSTCLGTASTYTYAQANAFTGVTVFAGQNDWRLPNIRELQTIVDRSTSNPAINSAVFPNTPNALFWSDSPFLQYSDSAWIVGFGTDGYGHYNQRTNSLAVRLVRGGQSSGGLLSITRPTSDYVDNRDGTVTHTPTNLIWKRCAEGMIWTGSTCSGTASSFTASQAEAVSSNFAGHGDWRLPTEDELVSLVDYSLLNPAMNTSIFPATPAAPGLYFWSASLYAKLSSSSWIVGFYDGLAQGNNSRNYGYPVRLVRNGQSPGSLVAPVCTLSASFPTINAGSSSTLTATCSPAASSYVWAGGTCAGTTGATCTVAPMAATTYTVTGNNTAGTGNTASAVVRVAGSSSATVPGTLEDDFFVPSGNNSYLGGGGNDTYIISPNTLRGAVTAKIIDTEGTNVIQLVGGMTIASSSFFMDAAQLMLSNGSIVQVLGASKFIYQLGANALTAETASNLSFAQFAAKLGASVPAAGAAAVSGTVNFVVTKQ